MLGHNRRFRTIALCLLTLFFAGCGVTTTTGGSVGNGSSASGTPPSGGAAPAVTATPTSVEPVVGTTGSCPDPTVNFHWPTSADVQVTQQQGGTTAHINVGQTAEVVLPTTAHWTLMPDSSMTVLQQQSPAGYTDTARSSCVWRFTGISQGGATLLYSKQAVCVPSTKCAQYITTVAVTITVN